MNTLVARLCLLAFVPACAWAQMQELKTIKLNEPDKKHGLSVMEALSLRASARGWSEEELSFQELSELLWAANGVNRPESKKRTAASAQNARDVDIYVFNKEGVYLYNAERHELTPVVPGDQRSQIAMRRPPGGPRPEASKDVKPDAAPAQTRPAGPQRQVTAPVQLVLVSDISRFGGGTPELKCEWGAIDTGIVSQNVALYCAANGLVTHPRAAINKEGLKALLKLTEAQHPFLELPVAYPKKN